MFQDTIIGTETKIVKQVSSWRPAGIHVGQIGAENDKDNEKHVG